MNKEDLPVQSISEVTIPTQVIKKPNVLPNKWAIIAVVVFLAFLLLSVLLYFVLGVKIPKQQTSSLVPAPSSSLVTDQTSSNAGAVNQNSAGGNAESEVVLHKQTETKELGGTVYSFEWDEVYLNQNSFKQSWPDKVLNVNFYSQKKGDEYKSLIKKDIADDFTGFPWAISKISSTSDFGKLFIECVRVGTDGLISYVLDTRTGAFLDEIAPTDGDEVGICNEFGKNEAHVQDNYFSFCEFSNSKKIYKYNSITGKSELIYTLRDSENIVCSGGAVGDLRIRVQGKNLLLDICKQTTVNDVSKYTVSKTLSIPLVENILPVVN